MKCWDIDPNCRPHARHIVEFFEINQRIVSPSLDGPESAVEPENQEPVDLKFPDRSRKLSIALNNRIPPASCSNRKRSMSGNMVLNVPPLTTSLSEDGITHTNIEALNLNHVMLEEANETGEDPLLPPQYVSSRFMTYSVKERDRERDNLMCKDKESLCKDKTELCPAEVNRDPWTSMTPV